MEIPVQKNKEYVVEIIDQGIEGEGIAKIDNYVIFIPGAIQGEKVKILIVKVLTSHAFGKLLEVIEKSPDRQENTDCKSYPRCGGCQLRHVKYEKTLIMKTQRVQTLVNKYLNNKVLVGSTIGMEEPYHYRNKAQYPVGQNKRGETVLGVFASRTHEIIPMENCRIQNPISEEIAKFILQFVKENKISAYNEITGKGILRHIAIKVGIKTNQVMCVLVTNEDKIPQEEKLKQELIAKFPEIRTIIQNINSKKTNVILGTQNKILYGEGYITDKLGEYAFKISPLSFYQTNPLQTEVLYKTAIELANLSETNNKVAFDLYCGIGTISLFLSRYFEKVYGIEIVEQAIQDAKENAKQNKVENVEFLLGDVEYALAELIQEKSIEPDVVFVDPPRRGLDKTTVDNLLKVVPKKIVYISCNPATLVRDLAMLEEKYEVGKIQPVDMFPFTSNVECCSVLYLKQDK